MTCRHSPAAVLHSLCDPRAQTAAMRMCPHCERLYVSGEIGPLSAVPASAKRAAVGERARKPGVRVPRRMPVTCPDCGAERTVCRELWRMPHFTGRCHPCGARLRWRKQGARRAAA